MYKIRIKNFRNIILYINQALENRITIDFLFSGWMITVFYPYRTMKVFEKGYDYGI